MKPILAIDPGASGGFAWQDSGGKVHCIPMPQTEDDVILFIRSRSCDGCAVTLEKVGGFISGSRGMGSSMFNFGMNFGIIKASAICFGMPLTLVTPQRWQKEITDKRKKDFNYEAVLTKGKNKGKTVIKNNWKEHLVSRAQCLFPQVQNISLKTADALLILHYAKLNIQS